MPHSSLYCVQKSASRASPAARNCRMATSPAVRLLLDCANAFVPCINKPLATVAPAAVSPVFRKLRRVLVISSDVLLAFIFFSFNSNLKAWARLSQRGEAASIRRRYDQYQSIGWTFRSVAGTSLFIAMVAVATIRDSRGSASFLHFGGENVREHPDKRYTCAIRLIQSYSKAKQPCRERSKKSRSRRLNY